MAKNQAKEAVTYRPSELAEMTGADPKRIRAFLRANFTRPAEQKNSSWIITEDQAAAVVGHFSPSDDTEE